MSRQLSQFPVVNCNKINLKLLCSFTSQNSSGKPEWILPSLYLRKLCCGALGSLRAQEVLTRSFLLAERGAFPLSVCLKSASLVSDIYFSILLI